MNLSFGLPHFLTLEVLEICLKYNLFYHFLTDFSNFFLIQEKLNMNVF